MRDNYKSEPRRDGKRLPLRFNKKQPRFVEPLPILPHKQWRRVQHQKFPYPERKQNKQEVQLQAKTKFEPKKEYLMIQKAERNTIEILNTLGAEDKTEYLENNCVLRECGAELFPFVGEMKGKLKNKRRITSLRLEVCHLVIKW